MTSVEFVDTDGATGTIFADLTIDYEGRFAETIDAVVSSADCDGTATDDDLQDISVELYIEGHFAKLDLVRGES